MSGRNDTGRGQHVLTTSASLQSFPTSLNLSSLSLTDHPVGRTPSIIILSFSAALYVIGFVAVAYALKNRHYPPLKAKRLPLLSLSLVASMLWWVGYLHSSNFFPYEGIWQLCGFWSVWVHFVLGIMLLLGLFNYRLYSLYQVFIRHRAISDTPLILPMLVYGIPSIAVGVVSSIFPDHTVWYEESVGQCRIGLLFKAILYSLVLLSLLTLGYLTFALRRVRRSFNEFSELRAGFIMALLTILINAAIVMSHASYTLVGKYIMTGMNLLASNFYFWLVLFRPLYGCIFHREEYLRRFVLALEEDGVVTESHDTESTEELEGSTGRYSPGGMMGTRKAEYIGPAVGDPYRGLPSPPSMGGHSSHGSTEGMYAAYASPPPLPRVSLPSEMGEVPRPTTSMYPKPPPIPPPLLRKPPPPLVPAPVVPSTSRVPDPTDPDRWRHYPPPPPPPPSSSRYPR
ncbi:MAG: hypothetical protein DHS80DRAFT_23369 [Piptocephalis tieghemiana]|nr:MAG: hypothetical protein DHS80DRAFT_23369 [Piptocephalis tieghemiana]